METFWIVLLIVIILLIISIFAVSLYAFQWFYTGPDGCMVCGKEL